MKIAMMTNNYMPFIGGVPISIERLTKELRKQGHQVVIFAPQYEPEMSTHTQEETAKEPETDVVRYRTLLNHFYGGIVLPNPLDRNIEKAFCEGDFDVIHVHHPVLIGRTALYLSKKYQVPLIYTYHTRYEEYLEYAPAIHWLAQGSLPDTPGSKTPFRQLRSALYRLIHDKIVPGYLNTFFRHCDYILTPTEGMKEHFLSQYGHYECETDADYDYEYKNRMEVLPTGLTDAAFALNMKNIPKPEPLPLLVTVARLSHEKNIPFLLEAMRELKIRYKKAFRLLIIGEGQEKESYMNYARELSLHKEVQFLGQQPNEKIPYYMAMADCFVFASKTETQGIVILEAMAAMTPVAAVAASGIEDVVEGGVNGFLCREDTTEFACALQQILEQPSLQKTLAQGAWETALKYREEEVAKKALCIYTDSCGRKLQTAKYMDRKVHSYECHL